MKLIPLNNTRKSKWSDAPKFTMVDDEDYEYLNQWNWYAAKCKTTFYIQRVSYTGGGRKAKKNKPIKMHRLIMKITDVKVFIDHKDGVTYNNQKYNLRTCNRSENGMNRIARWGKSKYIGVVHCRVKDKWNYWHASIRLNGKPIYLGSFPFTKEGEIRAARKRDEAAKKYFGEFANLNFKD